jgi:hypothetical protein
MIKEMATDQNVISKINRNATALKNVSFRKKYSLQP